MTEPAINLVDLTNLDFLGRRSRKSQAVIMLRCHLKGYYSLFSIMTSKANDLNDLMTLLTFASRHWIYFLHKKEKVHR